MINVSIGELGIEVRVRDEIEKGLILDDIKDAAYPPGDPRRYTDNGKLMMGISTSRNTGTEQRP